MSLFILFKGSATAITGATGGVGGVFAPSLFMGSAAGFVVAHVLKIAGIGFASELNFSLVGMAGVLSALLKAPLTSIFLIAEITGGYTLLIPLIVTSGVAYVVGRHFCPYSIYAEDLANRRELITHHKDRSALALMDPDSLIDSDFLMIPPDASISTLINIALRSSKSTVAVLDEEEHLLGSIRFDKVRKILLAREKYRDYRVSDIAEPVKNIIVPGTNMSGIISLFDETDVEEIPCVSGEGKFVGFINRSRVFEAYRNQVMDLSEDKE
jgi:CIC family chloride channel protein